MHPILLRIGDFVFPSYYVMISAGIITGICAAPYFFKRTELTLKIMINTGIIITATWIIGARLFHIVFEMPSYYAQNPWEMFKFWKGGFVLYGGFLFPVFITYWYSKKNKIPFLKISDAALPPSALGLSVGRLGCLMQGCCYGKHTTVPWAVVFPANAPKGTPTGIPVHPTQVYMSLNALLVFLVLLWYFKHKKEDGEITLLFFILYATGRTVIEFFRADYRGDFFEPYFSTSQFISVLLIIFCTAAWIKISAKKKRR